MAKKVITLDSISKDIGDLRAVVDSQKQVTTQQGQSIDDLKMWRLTTETATKAVDDYKQRELIEKNQKVNNTLSINKSEVFKYIVPFLIALTALVYAYTTRIK